VPPVAMERIKTSKAGILNKPLNHISGFTLIELVVVITILSTLLFFSLPMFRKTNIFQDGKKETGALIQLIQSLKQISMAENMDLFLHISTDSNLIWVTNSKMDQAQLQEAEHLAKNLSPLKIIQIKFPDKPDNTQGIHVIEFNKKGYSNMAIIHLNDGENPVSLKIQPFLMEITLVPGHISYNDCI
jgi:prepilin-type N-terminal cleavage/methylation domain-containing protein